ncbi:---NA--- [Paramuricea clavata]|uniref:---NA n=1 Tax=Paramuricea clavata TaxID=317549 RepID=A0A7D9H7G1_PARCT|nr:---NA--- [Paramuricea clavata]
MVDYRYTSHLKKEELEQEEALLKSVKDKLVDQLQRLKVEELAIVKYISMSNSTNLSQAASSTGSYFSANIQGDTDTNEIDKMNEEINTVPLVDLSEGLTSNSLISSSQAGVDQEEEEEDDDED